jgi:N utilization substance protein B
MAPTSTRREARERALHLAYERELRALDADELLADLPVDPDPYAAALVRGAYEHRREIDELLERFSQRWHVDRMPVVDRTLLRLAVYELCWVPEVDTPVVIDEAVELAKQYSTEDSPRFVNGLLSRIAQEVRPAAE